MNKNDEKTSVKIDCFAFRPERLNPCSALDSLYCEHGECPFYKTRKQFETEIEKYGWFQE